MKLYEIICVFHPDLTEEKITAVVTKIEGKIKSAGGEIKKVEKWGMKKLPFPPKRGKGVKDGFYVLIYFNGASSIPAEVTGLLRVTEGIITFVVAVSKGEPEAAVEKKEKEEEGKVEIASSMLKS